MAMKGSFLSTVQPASGLGRVRPFQRVTGRPPVMTSQRRAGGQAPNKTGPAAKYKVGHALSNDIHVQVFIVVCRPSKEMLVPAKEMCSQ